MAATINGVTFGDTTTNASGQRYLEGQPSVGMPNYEIENIASPGADGTDQKDFGFRGREIRADLAFIADNCPACIQAVATFSAGLVPARFSANISGISMTNVQAISVVPGTPFVIIGASGAVVAKCVASFHAIQRKM